MYLRSKTRFMKKILFTLLLLPFLASCQTAKKETQKKHICCSKNRCRMEKSASRNGLLCIASSRNRTLLLQAKYNSFYKEGTYVCAACKTELYYSKDKFDSKTGWPSFDRGATENIEFDVDYKLGYARTELKCNTCGGHLGHMFNDGPQQNYWKTPLHQLCRT